MAVPSVHRASPDEWRVYRQVRLATLREAPSAFWTTLADATLVTEEVWRRWLTVGGCFVAVIDGTPVGLAAGFREEDGTAELISMWVDPSWRGRGVAGQLVTAVTEWAARDGFATVHLWVAVGNDAAERLYARHQFARSGRVQAMHPDEPARREFEMVRAVTIGAP
ncbi:MAG: GNAT family N-acetyltransferase [Candidatus Dormibacter sp.]